MFSRVAAQSPASLITGTYSDGTGADDAVTELTLRADSTFDLIQNDPVFMTDVPVRFESSGRWSATGGDVILNPGKVPLQTEVRLVERIEPATDSITIRINWTVRSFKDEALVNEASRECDMVEVFINKRKNLHTLVRQIRLGTCECDPVGRMNQVLGGPTNTFRIARRRCEWIGLLADGLDSLIWMPVNDVRDNFFEINVLQSIDADRNPRNRKVVIKGNKAYYYTRNGRIDTRLRSLQRRN